MVEFGVGEVGTTRADRFKGFHKVVYRKVNNVGVWYHIVAIGDNML